MRSILAIHKAAPVHWVGNGFAARKLFSYERTGEVLSPFLMLDHAAPMEFPPSQALRGVAEHAHRGFETVTLVFSGEIEHRDSAGHLGRIGPGDVQWMTAASGILHQEFHSRDFARMGGTLHVAQLWVNLPARAKMQGPGYQDLRAAHIPCVELPDDSGTVRVVAGTFAGREGPAQTCTPLQVFDLHLRAGANVSFPLAHGHTAALAILAGTVEVNGVERAGADHVVVFDRRGGDIHVSACSDVHALLLGGEPLNEPIVGFGPFVMNTNEEIQQAITALHRGEFGELEPLTSLSESA